MSLRNRHALRDFSLAALLAGAATAAGGGDAPAPQPSGWQAASYRFLVATHLDGGVAPDDPRGFPFPHSYLDSPGYWAREVCHWPARDCAVVDRYDPRTRTLLPPAGPAGAWQLERLEVHHGSNLYDVALWQLAVVLGAGPGAGAGGGANAGAAWQAATAPTRMLLANAALREPGGYGWRMIAPRWLLDDPLRAQPWNTLVSAQGLPAGNADYQPGRVSWNDWQPVTGENAWFRLIGPLQAARLHYLALGQPAVPWHDELLQSAIASLPAFAGQQAANGAFYFTAALGSAGAEREVSIENNLSLYAGLQLLRATLRETEARGVTPAQADAARLRGAFAQLERLLEGKAGQRGLEDFLRGPAWAGQGFHTTGFVNTATGAWRAVDGPRAIDVQTWGIAALGAQRLDAWHGAGTALRLWQSLKAWGGYGEGTRLLGVGYSDRDGNGRDASGQYRQGVLSSEWTAGAIDAVRALRAWYGRDAVRTAGTAGTRAPGVPRAALAELAADEASMGEGFARLRIDRYAGAGFSGAPPHLRELLPVLGLPWLYASRRYAVPFGWMANPLPSTCATAWALLLDARYDPFGFGGRPN